MDIGEDEEGELHWTDNQISWNSLKMPLMRPLPAIVLHLNMTYKHKYNKYSKEVSTYII
jgi:hypothetical protein